MPSRAPAGNIAVREAVVRIRPPIQGHAITTRKVVIDRGALIIRTRENTFVRLTQTAEEATTRDAAVVRQAAPSQGEAPEEAAVVSQEAAPAEEAAGAVLGEAQDLQEAAV